MTRELTAAEHDVALSTGTAVLVFLMDSSPACQHFRPVLERFAARRSDVPFYVVDPTAEDELAKLHTLRALPTVIVYRDGLPLRRTAGGLSEQDLDEILDEVLFADMSAETADLLLEIAETEEVLSPLLPNGR